MALTQGLLQPKASHLHLLGQLLPLLLACLRFLIKGNYLLQIRQHPLSLAHHLRQPRQNLQIPKTIEAFQNAPADFFQLQIFLVVGF
ncbi:MAG: hypothetical protein Q6K99_02715 [Thermostichales cyanobacterium BF4_bins_65]